MAIWTQAGLSTFYGPAVVPSFGEAPNGFEYTARYFLDAVCGHRDGKRDLEAPQHWSRDAPRFEDPLSSDPANRRWLANEGWRVLVAGRATAPVLCANLNTLVSITGTRYFPDLSGHILVIEEMAAPFSRYERNLRHLQLLGSFEQLSGLIVSKPEMPDSEGAPFTADELLLEVVGARNYPIVVDFDCGHTHPMVTLAQGSSLTLDATGALARLTLNEAMVAS
jgi:muramoyltetrapeptide carboxypeptidase LdcA involved in peptidoglycan recycling